MNTDQNKAIEYEGIFEVRVASYVLVLPKLLAPFMLPHSGRNFSHAIAFEKLEWEIMEEVKQVSKKMGGRPKKPIKRDQVMHLKCTLIDRKVIQAKAKLANMTVSDYLLTM